MADSSPAPGRSHQPRVPGRRQKQPTADLPGLYPSHDGSYGLNTHLAPTGTKGKKPKKGITKEEKEDTLFQKRLQMKQGPSSQASRQSLSVGIAEALSEPDTDDKYNGQPQSDDDIPPVKPSIPIYQGDAFAPNPQNQRRPPYTRKGMLNSATPYALSGTRHISAPAAEQAEFFGMPTGKGSDIVIQPNDPSSPYHSVRPDTSRSFQEEDFLYNGAIMGTPFSTTSRLDLSAGMRPQPRLDGTNPAQLPGQNSRQQPSGPITTQIPGRNSSRPSSDGNNLRSLSGGNNAQPPSGQSNPQPPPSGNGPTPPTGANGSNPPSGGNGLTPSSGGSDPTPPPGGKGPTLPSGGSGSTPSPRGNSPTPPSSRNSTITPHVGNDLQTQSAGNGPKPPSKSENPPPRRQNRPQPRTPPNTRNKPWGPLPDYFLLVKSVLLGKGLWLTLIQLVKLAAAFSLAMWVFWLLLGYTARLSPKSLGSLDLQPDLNLPGSPFTMPTWLSWKHGFPGPPKWLIPTRDNTASNDDFKVISDATQRIIPDEVAVEKDENGKVKLPEGLYQATADLADANAESGTTSDGSASFNTWKKHNEDLRKKGAGHFISKTEVLKIMRDEIQASAGKTEKQMRESHVRLKNLESQVEDLRRIRGVSDGEVKALVQQHLARERQAALDGRNQASARQLLLNQVNFFSGGSGATIDPTYTSTGWRVPKSHFMSTDFIERAGYKTQPPTQALTAWDDEGECFCAGPDQKGNGAGMNTINVLVSRNIVPTWLVVEHISSAQTLDAGAMPKDIEVWASFEEINLRNEVRVFSEETFKDTPEEKILDESYVKIHHVTYKNSSTSEYEVQHFKMFDQLATMGAFSNHFVVRAINNHGADHTCFYRLRLYGDVIPRPDSSSA
ncbi:hypothetical protein F5Y15DRAFT_223539 [Xylariaceae sp. FL0016]|nr:hypothetical protein F5Y15DRAFT_223539 [Xylariaceae sp. FL0016]